MVETKTRMEAPYSVASAVVKQYQDVYQTLWGEVTFNDGVHSRFWYHKGESNLLGGFNGAGRARREAELTTYIVRKYYVCTYFGPMAPGMLRL